MIVLVVHNFFLSKFNEFCALLQLERTKNLLHEAKQPYNYLIQSITVRDDENRNMKGTIKSLHDDIT